MEWALWVVIIIVIIITLWWLLRRRNGAFSATTNASHGAVFGRGPQSTAEYGGVAPNPLAHVDYDQNDREYLRHRAEERQKEERHKQEHEKDKQGKAKPAVDGPASPGTNDAGPTDAGSGTVAEGAGATEASAPAGYVIKGDSSTKTFYRPGSPGFAAARADAWFRTVEEAKEAGFNPEKA